MKNNESGRSMIEMLGVLAIIGVLSIGGLAGYSKAMGKYKINKTTDQITQIVASTRALFAGHNNYGALTKNNTMNINLIKKGRLAPDEMISSDGTSLENAYAYGVTLSPSGKRAATDNKAFVISYAGVPQDACIELATQDWGAGMSAGLIGVCINKADMSAIIIGATPSACKSGECCVIGKTMTVIEAANACSGSTNTVSWKFF